MYSPPRRIWRAASVKKQDKHTAPAEPMTTAECLHVYRNSRLQGENFTPEAITAAYIAGLEALQKKAERENPAPLTKEEFWTLSRDPEGTPVWVVPLIEKRRDLYGWAVTDKDGNAFFPGIDNVWWEYPEYGKTWIAYRYKPQEEGGSDHAKS